MRCTNCYGLVSAVRLPRRALQHIGYQPADVAKLGVGRRYLHSMNRAVLILLISAAACFGGEPEGVGFKQLSDFIHSLPTREQVVTDVAVFRQGNPTAEQKRDAAERLTKAKEGFDRLKTLLQPTKSVFDYPGLLALARPAHSEAGQQVFYGSWAFRPAGTGLTSRARTRTSIRLSSTVAVSSSNCVPSSTST